MTKNKWRSDSNESEAEYEFEAEAGVEAELEDLGVWNMQAEVRHDPPGQTERCTGKQISHSAPPSH